LPAQREKDGWDLLRSDSFPSEKIVQFVVTHLAELDVHVGKDL
jgi:hypothetical protein